MPKGAPPLPPFEKWSFKERRYIQWLVDMHNAHYALEASVADATVVASTEHYGEQKLRDMKQQGILTLTPPQTCTSGLPEAMEALCPCSSL